MSATAIREPEVTLALAEEHGLTEEEYGWIVEKLGRTPTFVELGIYSVMWSEHCSYKNSIALLKTLPREGEQLSVEAGEENAGLVDIGDGLAVAFKIESHNHPSAVEPYQGAATGVGGIQRDIFTMGARPIASLNSLRFGSLDNARVRFCSTASCAGSAATATRSACRRWRARSYFDPAYEGNPLVNAMSVGIVKVGETVERDGRGRRQPGLHRRLGDGPRRDPRRDVRLGGDLRSQRGQASERPGRRPVHREAACSKPVWTPSRRARSSGCRTWARRGSRAPRAR